MWGILSQTFVYSYNIFALTKKSLSKKKHTLIQSVLWFKITDKSRLIVLNILGLAQ